MIFPQRQPVHKWIGPAGIQPILPITHSAFGTGALQRAKSSPTRALAPAGPSLEPPLELYQ